MRSFIGSTSRSAFLARLLTLSVLGVCLLALGAPAPTAAQAQRDIVDTAVAAGNFSTLARALQAAGLVDTLKGPGPFTVFAPTDAAFAKLPQAQLNALLNNPAQLRAVLTYHVVPGRVTAADVVRLSNAQTVQGERIAINVTGNTVRLNNSAAVTQTDIRASNGVIHVIDTVLLPPSLQPGQMPRAGEGDNVALPLALAVVAAAFVGGGLGLRAAARRA